MKNILVPISFSETSKNALLYANLIAKKHNATITLMHCYSVYAYNREYDFGPLNYNEGIKKMLVEFYTNNIESIDQQPLRVLANEGSVSEYISEISNKYGLLVLSKKMGKLSNSNKWFGDKLFSFATKSSCPVLLLPSKQVVFSFSELKNIWHIQRKDIETDLINRFLLKFKIDPNMVISKSLEQETFTSEFWRNIVSYSKKQEDSQLKKIHESYNGENIDLLILVNHRTGMFEKFLKDNTFQIMSQFDIPILVLQAKK